MEVKFPTKSMKHFFMLLLLGNTLPNLQLVLNSVLRLFNVDETVVDIVG